METPFLTQVEGLRTSQAAAGSITGVVDLTTTSNQVVTHVAASAGTVDLIGAGIGDAGEAEVVGKKRPRRARGAD